MIEAPAQPQLSQGFPPLKRGQYLGPAPEVTIPFTELALSSVYEYGIDATLPFVTPVPEFTK